MQQARLVWNFSIEFNSAPSVADLALEDKQADGQFAYEKRFFWPAAEEVVIRGLDKKHLHFAHYTFKQRQDCYLLSPDLKANVKIRKGKVHYKALDKMLEDVACFAQKQKFIPDEKEAGLLQLLPPLAHWTHNDELHHFLQQHYQLLDTSKEAFILKIDPRLGAKLEFARITVASKDYLSFCVEAKNQTVVDSLSKILMPNQPALTYIQFLKSILS